MDKNLHNIEDLFHAALDDNEETPSQNVWEKIDRQLDKDNIVSIKRKYTNLKRFAVMLLLLLISFALFDVYKINTLSKGNGLAKYDNSIKSDKQSKSNIITGKGSEKNTETNSAVITDTSSNINDRKDKPSPEDITTNNQKLTNQHQDVPIDKTQLQKLNKVEKIYSSKNIKKTQEDLTSNQKKKRNTKGSYRIKITSPDPVEDKESTDQNDYADNQIPYLPKKNTRPPEEDKLKTKDSTDTKKLSTLIVSAKPKIADSSNNTIAKTASKKTSKSSRFSFTPFFSPDIAWYRLQDDKTGQPDNASEIEKEEKHEFSSTFGILADYKINKHWGLQSGVTLSNTNITVNPKTIYAQQDNTGGVKYRINTSSGYGYVLPSFSTNPAIGDSLYAFTSTHSLQYIGIPLAVTYNITKGKFKFNALAGIAANILTKAKLEATLEKGFNNSIETLDNIRGLKKVYFSGLAGIGVDYKLTKKTALVFEPTMRFALNSINKDAPVKSYPMSFGFNVGLKIGL
ncbi:MAG: outer membrane beta-barrel protein [Niastella sp.]|nr:outer membrane beta-barrel protein [Niastella sp.]